MKVINNDEYGKLICQLFGHEFFKTIDIRESELLDIITLLLVSTKENRYGPHPGPESLVTIRKTIKESIDSGFPIPVLIPWGGRKTDTNSLIDIAEVSAINQINTLNRNIKQYFSPGLTVNIRVEDTGAYWLYRGEKGVIPAVDKYSEDFSLLVKLIRDEKFIFPIKESNLMNTDEYFTRSIELSSLIMKVITTQLAYPDKDPDTIEEFRELKRQGWKGNIPPEQRDYYLGRYRSLYPGIDNEKYVEMVADYFAGAKSRYELNGRANPESPIGLPYNSFIQLSFVPPIPDAPVSLFNNTLYWRTVPASQGRTHISPWRGKGYFKITDSEIISKVVSFSDPIVKELIPSCTIIQDDVNSLKIQTDYIIE